MNEHKNTILAIVLSLIVLIGWEYFFANLQVQQQQRETVLKKQEKAGPGAPAAGRGQPGATPSPEGSAPSNAGRNRSSEPPTIRARRCSRYTAHRHPYAAAPRHVDLKGGRIDDLSLEQYPRRPIDPHSPPIVLLSPSGAPERILCRVRLGAGFGHDHEPMPGPDTVWKQDGTGPLERRSSGDAHLR